MANKALVQTASALCNFYIIARHKCLGGGVSVVLPHTARERLHNAGVRTCFYPLSGRIRRERTCESGDEKRHEREEKHKREEERRIGVNRRKEKKRGQSVEKITEHTIQLIYKNN